MFSRVFLVSCDWGKAEEGDTVLLHLNIILVWFEAIIFKALGFVAHFLGSAYTPYIPSVASLKRMRRKI